MAATASLSGYTFQGMVSPVLIGTGRPRRGRTFLPLWIESFPRVGWAESPHPERERVDADLV